MEPLEKIDLVRRSLIKQNLDGLIVRGTDRFLNEYVPENESLRVWLSGFTGSTGDILVTLTEVFLFVDGRYYLQAENQVDPELIQIVKVPLGTSLEKALIHKIVAMCSKTNHRIGYSPDQFSIESFERFRKGTETLDLVLVPISPLPLEEIRGPIKEKIGKIWKIDISLSGLSTSQKLVGLRDFMLSHNISFWIVQALDEIAYLTNLRGNEIAYQATFKSFALITLEKVFLALPQPKRVERVELENMKLIDMDKWINALNDSNKKGVVGFDPSTTTEATRLILTSRSIPYLSLPSPLARMKSQKNPEELLHMLKSFKRADSVVAKAKNWVCRKVRAGEAVTEAAFSEKVSKLFKQSGAFSLSFHIISAAGKNGAIIHYSNPDPNRIILSGELLLLDTGAYYEGGYATDLTRTFLVGDSKSKGSNQQMKIFTLVLKGAIAGMSATFPKGTSGAAIDTIVRAPLWEAGYNYNHGTGHGVGINVHESPPRISTQGDPIEKGQIFSIEPGIYIPDFGGVRIENLCTVIDHPKYPDWLMVTPLTFSPFDDRLIDTSLLTRIEKKWLKWYKDQSKISHSFPPLPPIWIQG
ncbi:MAG: M24 family metallopeptidase [Nitrospiria bacterium]